MKIRKVSQSGLDWGFPGGSVVKNPPANAGDTGYSPWSAQESDTARQQGLGYYTVTI